MRHIPKVCKVATYSTGKLDKSLAIQLGSSTPATERNTSHVKAVLELMCQIEERLNSPGSRFHSFDAAFVPVGSIREGTRIHSTNEADFMVFFGLVLMMTNIITTY